MVFFRRRFYSTALLSHLPTSEDDKIPMALFSPQILPGPQCHLSFQEFLSIIPSLPYLILTNPPAQDGVIAYTARRQNRAIPRKHKIQQTIQWRLRLLAAFSNAFAADDVEC